MNASADVSRAPAPTVVRSAGLNGRLWVGGKRHVVCLPAAGSSSLTFRPLAEALAGRATVLALDPPERRSSLGRHDLSAIAGSTAAAVGKWPADDIVLLGHSFGGYVAYEVARRLLASRASAGQVSLRLVLVGCAAPTAAVAIPYADGDDAALVTSLRLLGGVPDLLLRDPALLRRYLPAVRADLEALAAYVRSFRPPAVRLAIPTLAVCGSADPLVPFAALPGWADLCNPSWLRLLPGDHYVPQHQAARLGTEMMRWADSLGPATRGTPG